MELVPAEFSTTSWVGRNHPRSGVMVSPLDMPVPVIAPADCVMLSADEKPAAWFWLVEFPELKPSLSPMLRDVLSETVLDTLSELDSPTETEVPVL
jgi:hypothetical protein